MGDLVKNLVIWTIIAVVIMSLFYGRWWKKRGKTRVQLHRFYATSSNWTG